MKRFIATFMSALMLVAAMATTAFAADYTLTLSTDVDSAKAGEYVKVFTNLDSNVGVKALQFSITFDPNDFEIAEDPACIEDADEYIPAKNYVPYEYWVEYGDVKSARKWGDATIGAEQRAEGYCVTFAYAKATAVSTLVEDMLVGGAYLKVKSATAKTSDIKLTYVTIGDGAGAKKEVESNTVAFNITADAPSVEVATSGAWKTDKGLLVIGKVTGEYTEKGITVDGYVTPEVARDPGVGPNFVATAPASAQGYYGVLIKGIAAGSYTVNAYVDTVKGATTSVTID